MPGPWWWPRKPTGLFRNTLRTLSQGLTLLWEMRDGIHSGISCISTPMFFTGCTTTIQHNIKTNNTQPVRCGQRRLAPTGLRTEQTCKDMLGWGHIEPSDSPWASPVVLVTRFCVDYRRLNALTVKDAYPLLRIDDSLRLLGNQQWFSTMDLASGYWQVAMSTDAKRKAAFVTHEGLYQFLIIPFGLCSAPATFERLMDRVLCGMRWSRCLYLDDVISFGTDALEALMHIEEVL